MGMDIVIFNSRNWSGFKAFSGDYDETKGEKMSTVPDEIDYAILRIHVTNVRDRARMFGGASPEELDLISFTEMAKAKTWKITPSLKDIQTVMHNVGGNNTILSIDFRQPYVIDRESDILNAGAILATFGVSDEAVMDILSGKFKPSGKLPFALANSLKAILEQDPDAPGYPEKDTLFPFGFGLTY